MENEEELEDRVRDGMIRQLRQNLAKCRRIILDESLDLKTRERWTQLYTNTSQVLNQILKDRKMREWERKMKAIEEHEKTGTWNNTQEDTRQTVTTSQHP